MVALTYVSGFNVLGVPRIYLILLYIYVVLRVKNSVVAAT
ncbi:hypothetical protein MNBD_GAMMA15-1673 [hydrothermal vent metagenome]|uniref:Uncharacterized protein n=1 Tax=hydrothermal vent metagenome TaxID=652676 RepID=A0A3B0YHN9_9ZZZZ